MVNERKACTKCRENKQLSEFGPGRATCAPCRRAIENARYAANSAKRIRQADEWRRANPEKVKGYRTGHNQKQRAKRASVFVDPNLPSDYRGLLLDFYGACLRCGSWDNLEIDHVTPISKGGSHELSNMQVLCKPCNSSKGNRSSVDFRNGIHIEGLSV